MGGSRGSRERGKVVGETEMVKGVVVVRLFIGTQRIR